MKKRHIFKRRHIKKRYSIPVLILLLGSAFYFLLYFIYPLNSTFAGRVLKVPSYRQQHKYTCFSAAARSALAYRGIKISESKITSLIGYDRTRWSGKWGKSNAKWGDPNIGMVGNIDGKGGPGWGYGAHWNPVARVIARYRPVVIKTHWTVSGIAKEIDKGNPVIVWWVNGKWPAYYVRWHKGKKVITAVNSMHVQVVKGYAGSSQKPSAFYMTDSGYGYPGKKFDVKTFKKRWKWFNNTAIIVK